MNYLDSFSPGVSPGGLQVFTRKALEVCLKESHLAWQEREVKCWQPLDARDKDWATVLRRGSQYICACGDTAIIGPSEI